MITFTLRSKVLLTGLFLFSVWTIYYNKHIRGGQRGRGDSKSWTSPNVFLVLSIIFLLIITISILDERVRAYVNGLMESLGVNKGLPCLCLNIIYPTNDITEDKFKKALLIHFINIGYIYTRLSDITILSWENNSNETIIFVKVSCNPGEECVPGVQTLLRREQEQPSSGSNVEGLDNIRMSLLIGEQCITDLTINEHSPTQCKYSEEINLGTSCVTPRDLQDYIDANDSGYSREVLLDNTSEDAPQINLNDQVNKSRANFNVAVQCSPNYSSDFRTSGGEYYINTKCEADDYYYQWGTGELGTCQPNCTEPGEDLSRTILPDNQNTTFSGFDVKYECNTGYSQSGLVKPESHQISAVKCDSGGSPYTADECILDCTHPSNRNEFVLPSSADLNPSRFDISGVICNSDGYAEGTDGVEAVSCAGTGNPGYSVTGCKLKCIEPNNKNYYTYDLDQGSNNSSKDHFNLDGLTCNSETSISSGVAGGHACNDYGETFGLTGCYPACSQYTDCLNFTVTYPDKITIDESTFKSRIISQLNSQEGGNEFDVSDITYYNKVDTESGGTLIEYQVTCKYSDCSVIRDIGDTHIYDVSSGMLSSPGVSSHRQDECTGCCGDINNAVLSTEGSILPGRFITNKPANAGGDEDHYQNSYCQSAVTQDQCLGVGFDLNIDATAATQSSDANTSQERDKFVSYKTRYPDYCQWTG